MGDTELQLIKRLMEKIDAKDEQINTLIKKISKDEELPDVISATSTVNLSDEDRKVEELVKNKDITFATILCYLFKRGRRYFNSIFEQDTLEPV